MLELKKKGGEYSKDHLIKAVQTHSAPKSLFLPLKIATEKKVYEENKVKKHMRKQWELGFFSKQERNRTWFEGKKNCRYWWIYCVLEIKLVSVDEVKEYEFNY